MSSEVRDARGTTSYRPPVPRWRYQLLSVALLFGALLLFAIANRGAYKSFFQADSIDNIALTQMLGFDDLYRPLFVPKVFFNNFRPVGMFFFKVMGAQFGLWFPPYVAALQILHIINVAIMVWLMRKLKLPFWASCAGALFFAFHMALFSVYWEPMYVFDLLCGSLCLLSLITYVDGYWIVSFLLFWLAYRAKDNAIMLPMVFAAYEVLLGKRRWKRLIPFFALSLAIGVQVLINNAARDSNYTLRFDPMSLWKCMAFYSTQLLLIPFAGFLILALPVLVRNRKMWFGFASFCILLAPMLILPGRLFSPYLYVPLIGVAICVAVLAQLHPKVVAILLVLWIPWNYINLRWLRKAELARADAARVYVANVMKVAQKYPRIDTFLFHDIPMARYAIPAVVHLSAGTPDVKVFEVNDREALARLQSDPVIVLDWEALPSPGSVVALVHTSETPDSSYIRLDRGTPLWQLESGWNLDERGPYRWIQPLAIARLSRPAHARHFELTVNVTDALLRYVHHSHLRVLLDGHLIGENDFDRDGLQLLRWDIEESPPGPSRVTFEVQPGFKIDAQEAPLGLNVGSFGFIEE